MEGIIFDMDGTLWDSSKEVADSWTEVLMRTRDAAGRITEEDMKSVMGMTMTGIAKTLFPDLPEKRQLALLAECTEYENRYLRERGGRLYPGLEETLKLLSGRYPLFIVSNCQNGYIEAFLEHYGFGKYFQDTLCFGENGRQKADNIRELARRNSLDVYYYVGDIQADCDAAMEAGARFIHAAYGFGRVWQEVPAIQSFAELPDLMTRWEPR